MGEKIEQLKRVPWIAHILRMLTRFKTRLGNEFAAGITYFSVLAIVPILAFIFAAAGFTLTVLRPELLEQFKTLIYDQLQLAPAGLRDQLNGVIDSTLGNWRGIGIVGLLSAMYAGGNWVGHLKSAVRAQWRPDFDLTENKRMIVLELLVNLALLIGLFVLLILTFGIVVVSTGLTQQIIDLLSLQSAPVLASLATRVAPIFASILAGWLLFVFIYKTLPETPVPFVKIAKGALIGAVVLATLQYFLGFLITALGKNKAIVAFGSVILAMLLLNLIARLILMMAAWIATSVQPAVSGQWETPDEPLLDEPKADVQKPVEQDLREDAPFAEASARAKGRWGTQRGVFIGPERLEYTEPDAKQRVPQDVAARSVRIGMGAGWITGAATGVGVGALVVSAFHKITGRKDQHKASPSAQSKGGAPRVGSASPCVLGGRGS